jgi:hypothetical protein
VRGGNPAARRISERRFSKGRPRKEKDPPFATGPSLREKNAASHLQRRKLATFRPGRLWLFTHSTAATGGQLNREIIEISTA